MYSMKGNNCKRKLPAAWNPQRVDFNGGVFCFLAGISSFTIQPTSLVVTQGSVARFSCKITAQPPPIITWEFNRVPLPLVTERCVYVLIIIINFIIFQILFDNKHEVYNNPLTPESNDLIRVDRFSINFFFRLMFDKLLFLQDFFKKIAFFLYICQLYVNLWIYQISRCYFLRINLSTLHCLCVWWQNDGAAQWCSSDLWGPEDRRWKLPLHCHKHRQPPKERGRHPHSHPRYVKQLWVATFITLVIF